MEDSIVSIPCQWDEESIDQILKFKMENGIHVKEMYGTISSEHIPHGRAKNVTKQVSRDDALRIKKKLDDKGIKFAYLINAPVFSDTFEFLDEELDWIINTFKASSITISSLELMKYVHKKYPDMHLNISTIAGVKTVEDLKKYGEVKPYKVVTHHDANKNFQDLKELIEYTNKEGIKLEIMVNESCLRRCKNRVEHYNTLGNECDDYVFHLGCNSLKITQPYQLLLSNYIRPEDVYMYEELGIHMFKITGRSKPIGWLSEVVKAYLNRSFDGNVMRLLALDPKLKSEEWIFINNKALDGMLQQFPKNGVAEEEVEYCEKKILDLFRNTDFYIQGRGIAPEVKEQRLRYHINCDIYA